MSAGTGTDRGWLSFWRIVDIPFGTCVAALDSWQLTGRPPAAGQAGRRAGAAQAGAAPGQITRPGQPGPGRGAPGPAGRINGTTVAQDQPYMT